MPEAVARVRYRSQWRASLGEWEAGCDSLSEVMKLISLVQGSILGSFHPNRLVLTLLEGNMMDRLEHLMAELRYESNH